MSLTQVMLYVAHCLLSFHIICMTYGTLNYLTVWDGLERVYDKARCDLQSNEDRTVASPPF